MRVFDRITAFVSYGVRIFLINHKYIEYIFLYIDTTVLLFANATGDRITCVSVRIVIILFYASLFGLSRKLLKLNVFIIFIIIDSSYGAELGAT